MSGSGIQSNVLLRGNQGRGQIGQIGNRRLSPLLRDGTFLLCLLVMARFARIVLPEIAHRGYPRQAISLEDQDRFFYLQVLADYLAQV